jgi:hypothetical protein
MAMSEPTALQYLIEGIPAIFRLRIRLWIEDFRKLYKDILLLLDI